MQANDMEMAHTQPLVQGYSLNSKNADENSSSSEDDDFCQVDKVLHGGFSDKLITPKHYNRWVKKNRNAKKLDCYLGNSNDPCA